MDVPPCLQDPDAVGSNYADSPCHGYLTDICECKFSDIFTETAYISTIFVRTLFLPRPRAQRQMLVELGGVFGGSGRGQLGQTSREV
jgi:hypothetical protein